MYRLCGLIRKIRAILHDDNPPYHPNALPERVWSERADAFDRLMAPEACERGAAPGGCDRRVSSQWDGDVVKTRHSYYLRERRDAVCASVSLGIGGEGEEQRREGCVDDGARLCDRVPWKRALTT